MSTHPPRLTLAAYDALPHSAQDAFWSDLAEHYAAVRSMATEVEQWALARIAAWPESRDWPSPLEWDRIKDGRQSVRTQRVTVDTGLEQIPPPTYFLSLAGIDVLRPGMNVMCPVPEHQDDTPSCQVWAEPAKGWFCHACRKGGTIYDLGAALWGLRTRGDDFKEIRNRLEQHFGLADA